MRKPLVRESFLRYPTSTLLGTPGSVRVLRELTLEGEPLAVTELAARTSLTNQAVRNTVAELAEAGVVKALGAGRSRLYQADVSHPLYVALGSLFHAEAERFDTVRSALVSAAENLTPQPLAAWIYGGVARGEDRAHADVEVALVAADDAVEVAVERLEAMLEPAGQVQRVWFSVVGLTPSDVRRLAKGDAWWRSATSPSLAVFGPAPAELAASLARPERTRPTFAR